MLLLLSSFETKSTWNFPFCWFNNNDVKTYSCDSHLDVRFIFIVRDRKHDINFFGLLVTQHINPFFSPKKPCGLICLRSQPDVCVLSSGIFIHGQLAFTSVWLVSSQQRNTHRFCTGDRHHVHFRPGCPCIFIITTIQRLHWSQICRVSDCTDRRIKQAGTDKRCLSAEGVVHESLMDSRWTSCC